MKYVRIENNVWEASSADLKNFGFDAEVFKIRARSAKIAFTYLQGEWFRASSTLRHDDSTAVTKAERKIIDKAMVLKVRS